MGSDDEKGRSSREIQPALGSPTFADVEDPHPRQSTTEVCIRFLFAIFTIASVLLFISAVLSYHDGDFIPPAVVFGFAVTCFALFSLLSTARCWVFLRARMPAVPGNRRHGFRNSGDFTGGRKLADVGGWQGFWVSGTPTKVGVVVNGVVDCGKSVAGLFRRRRPGRFGESHDLGKEEEAYGTAEARETSTPCDSGTTYGQGQSSKTRTLARTKYEQVPSGIERVYQKEKELVAMTLPNSSTAPSSKSTFRARDAVSNTRPTIQVNDAMNPYAPHTSDAQLAELARKKFTSDSKNYFRPHSAGPRGRDIAPQAEEREVVARSTSHATGYHRQPTLPWDQERENPTRGQSQATSYRRGPILPWEEERERSSRGTPHAASSHRGPTSTLPWEQERECLNRGSSHAASYRREPPLSQEEECENALQDYASRREQAEAHVQQRGRQEYRSNR